MSDGRDAMEFQPTNVATRAISTGGLLAFFCMTFVVTWTAFITAGFLVDDAAMGAGLTPVPRVLIFLGAISPAFVALWLTSRTSGRAGVRALLGQIMRWRVAIRWYVFAAGFMIAIKLSAALLHRVVRGEWPAFGDTPLYLMAAAILVSTWVQAGEELGWRGYALQGLASRMGFAPASILLGVVWALWHLPLFFIAGPDTSGQSFSLYLMQVTAISVAMAWLYVRTHYSLLLVMIMHAAVNNTKDIVPSGVAGASNPFSLSGSLIGWLTLVLLWVCATFFLVRMSREGSPRAAERDVSGSAM